MPAITIHDSDPRGVLRFDLIDLLRLAGSDAVAATWRCSGVEATGPLADELHVAADVGNAIGGNELLRIAGGVMQVIDGDFLAFSPSADEPWLRISAIDSSLFVVATADTDLLDRIRAAFHDVLDSPLDDV